MRLSAFRTQTSSCRKTLNGSGNRRGSGLTSLPLFSHELKTPIAIIKGELEGMIYQVGDYKDRDTYLRHCMKTVNDMERIVQDILSAARMGGKRLSAGAGRPGTSAGCCRKPAGKSWAGSRIKVWSCGRISSWTSIMRGMQGFLEKVFSNVLGQCGRLFAAWRCRHCGFAGRCPSQWKTAGYTLNRRI